MACRAATVVSGTMPRRLRPQEKRPRRAKRRGSDQLPQSRWPECVGDPHMAHCSSRSPFEAARQMLERENKHSLCHTMTASAERCRRGMAEPARNRLRPRGDAIWKRFSIASVRFERRSGVRGAALRCPRRAASFFHSLWSNDNARPTKRRFRRSLGPDSVARLPSRRSPACFAAPEKLTFERAAAGGRTCIRCTANGSSPENPHLPILARSCSGGCR